MFNYEDIPEAAFREQTKQKELGEQRVKARKEMRQREREQSFIENIYSDGLTMEVITRHKKYFPDMTLIVEKNRKCIQVGAFQVSFECEEDDKGGHLSQGKYIYYATTASFPNDDIISIFELENFNKIHIVQRKEMV